MHISTDFEEQAQQNVKPYIKLETNEDIPFTEDEIFNFSARSKPSNCKFWCTVCLKTCCTVAALKRHAVLLHSSRRLMHCAYSRQQFWQKRKVPFGRFRYPVQCTFCGKLVTYKKCFLGHQSFCCTVQSLPYLEKVFISSCISCI